MGVGRTVIRRFVVAHERAVRVAAPSSGTHAVEAHGEALVLGETCGANGMGAAWVGGCGGVGSSARGRHDHTAVAHRESGEAGGYGARLPAFQRRATRVPHRLAVRTAVRPQ
ncbi:hypothetical protein Q0Z83_057140 [Actinoplanes sichuanensis]|nr:hypothetical protein Q0Z83_057140 [Actinoplanes sichuanensis]